MKNRHKGKVLTNAKRKPNPLRQDPTRSVTMRRAFAGKIGWMFMRLKGTILRRILEGDALGLRPVRREVLNVFCATGPGGGVDPTCGKGDWSVPLFHSTSKWNVDSIKSNGFNVAPGTFGEGVYFSLKEHAGAATGTNAKDAATIKVRVDVKRPLEMDLRGADESKWKGYAEWMAITKGDTRAAGRQALLDAGYDAVSVKFGTTEYRLILDPSKIKIVDMTANVFCPTGEGGGVDPTCSPGEGGSTAASTKAGRVMSRFRAIPAAVASRIRTKVIEKYTSLETRYGSRYAKAIIGAALVGLPVPLPGASMALAAPVVALAELHRLVSGKGRAAVANEEDLGEMTDEEIAAAVAELVNDLQEEFGDLVGDVPTVNPFVSEDQRRACYAADDPDWDCEEWEEKTGGKDLPKAVENCAAGQMRDATTGRCGPGIGVDVPRAEMPQIRGNDFLDFVAFAAGKGVRVYEDQVPVDDLSPVQREFRQERVDSIPHAKALFEPIIVSQDDYVLDGTHRWVKVWQRNKGAKMQVARVDLPLREALDLMRSFPRAEFAANADDNWRFRSDPKKVEAFKKWLEQQIGAVLVGRSQQQLWDKYIQDGFKKGQGRAFDDATRSEKVIAAGREKLDFYAGTRDQFLKSSFGRPVAVEKVQLLAGRTFDELKGITADMSLRMTRKLTDGLVQGKSPREVARDLNAEVDIGWTRALTVARTELIRAHAEGQLTALEDLGVEDVGVAVEWSTTGDDRVCEECQPLEGVVMKLEEARGMLPRHPNCRCAWIPANVGEDKRGQKATRGSITGAIRSSRKASGDEDDEGWGPGKAVSKDRPQSVLNELDRKMAEALGVD